MSKAALVARELIAADEQEQPHTMPRRAAAGATADLKQLGDPEVREAFDRWKTDAAARGFRIEISSGDRPVEWQRARYAQARPVPGKSYRIQVSGRGKGLPIAAPGRSNHNPKPGAKGGRAVDVQVYDSKGRRVSQGAVAELAKAHGFHWLGKFDPVHFDYKPRRVTLFSQGGRAATSGDAGGQVGRLVATAGRSAGRVAAAPLPAAPADLARRLIELDEGGAPVAASPADVARQLIQADEAPPAPVGGGLSDEDKLRAIDAVRQTQLRGRPDAPPGRMDQAFPQGLPPVGPVEDQRLAEIDRRRQAQLHERVYGGGPELVYDVFLGREIRPREGLEHVGRFAAQAFSPGSTELRDRLVEEFRQGQLAGRFPPSPTLSANPKERDRQLRELNWLRARVGEAQNRLLSEATIPDPNDRTPGAVRLKRAAASLTPEYVEQALAERGFNLTPYQREALGALTGALRLEMFRSPQIGQQAGLDAATTAAADRIGAGVAGKVVGRIAAPVAQKVIGGLVEGAVAGGLQQPATRKQVDPGAGAAQLAREAAVGAAGGAAVGGAVGGLGAGLDALLGRAQATAAKLAQQEKLRNPFPPPPAEPLPPRPAQPVQVGRVPGPDVQANPGQPAAPRFTRENPPEPGTVVHFPQLLQNAPLTVQAIRRDGTVELTAPNGGRVLADPSKLEVTGGRGSFILHPDGTLQPDRFHNRLSREETDDLIDFAEIAEAGGEDLTDWMEAVGPERANRVLDLFDDDNVQAALPELQARRAQEQAEWEAAERAQVEREFKKQQEGQFLSGRPLVQALIDDARLQVWTDPQTGRKVRYWELSDEATPEQLQEAYRLLNTPGRERRKYLASDGTHSLDGLILDTRRLPYDAGKPSYKSLAQQEAEKTIAGQKMLREDARPPEVSPADVEVSPVPAAAAPVPAGGLERNFNAGMNTGRIRFADETQRDLYDAGAALRKASRTGDSRVHATAQERVRHLAQRLGVDEGEARSLAADVHTDVREQMKGLGDGEVRTVRNRVALPETALRTPPSAPENFHVEIPEAAVPAGDAGTRVRNAAPGGSGPASTSATTPGPPSVGPDAPRHNPPPATGLANQVQERELDLIAPPEKGVGRGAAQAHAEGVRAVRDDGADFEALARQVADGERPFTWREAGVLLEGKRRLVQGVNAARDALDAAVRGKADRKQIAQLQTAYEAAKARLQEYVDNVQKGKTEWSNTGRALQAGTELDSGDFAAVLSEARRVKGEALTDVQERTLKRLTDEITKRDGEIARLEMELLAAETQRAVRMEAPPARGRAGRLSREKIREERLAIYAELEQILNAVTGTLNDPGNVIYNSARMGRVAGKLAVNYMKEAGITLEEVITRTLADLRSRGVQAQREDVIRDIAEVTRSTRRPTQDELRKQLARLKREAAAEARRIDPARQAAKAQRAEVRRAQREAATESRLQEQIRSLEEQLRTGDYADPPTKQERQIAKRIADLRALRDLRAREVKARVDSLKPKHPALALAQGAADLIRGTVLGSDVGVLTRQGLFAWSHPVRAAQAAGRAVKAAISEAEMAKWEIEVRERRINGESAALARKRAGLQLTDTVNEREELLVARLAKRLPLAARLERFQTTFINSVRADLFDDALRAGWSPEELKLRAQFINAATGRGNVRNVPEILSLIMTSPRYEASRWEMLAAPVRNAGALGASAVRGEGLNRAALMNLRDMGVTAAGIVALYKLAEAAGYQVDWNPESTDFLKMRRGNEVWDPTAGLAVRARDVIRIWVWGTHPEYGKNLGELARKAGVRVISPGVRIPIEQVSFRVQRAQGVRKPKSPFEGFESDDERKGLLVVAPIIWQSTSEALAEGGTGAAAWTGAREFVGQGVSRYPKPKQ